MNSTLPARLFVSVCLFTSELFVSVDIHILHEFSVGRRKSLGSREFCV